MEDSMLRKKMIAGAILLLISVTAQGQGFEGSMKGYELYGWKANGIIRFL
jgi:hypothetical protein